MAQCRYRSEALAEAIELEPSMREQVAHEDDFNPIRHDADFERMIRETRAQTIIVTTMDSTHDDYIVRALHAGCDVITEKPMTTDAAKCRAILPGKPRPFSGCSPRSTRSRW